MHSVAAHHPDWDRYVVLIDPPGRSVEDEERFTLVSLASLALPEPLRFAFRYTLLEMSTAVKPWAFTALFARGYERVVYFDPDIQLYSAFDELDALAADTLLALTPHLTVPSSGRVSGSERAVLQSGAYNLGFLAVQRHAELDAFLSWWRSKLEFDCVSDVEHGLFVDQKWMDLAPGLFPGVVVLRHDGCNVAYWNLRQRRVTQVDGRWQVNVHPLRFFHFSGIDRADAHLVSVHDPWLRLDEVGEAGALVEDYRRATHDAGEAAFATRPYAFGAFADGTRVSDAARKAYRRSASLQATCGDDPFRHQALFRGMADQIREPELARAGVRVYQWLSSPRALVKLLPERTRRLFREALLGKDP